MSRNSKKKRDARMRKKKGPGPGDRAKRATIDIEQDDSIYKRTDIINESAKPANTKDTVVTPPVRRQTRRGS